MQKQLDFNGKKIFFVADSNLTRPYFLEYLREIFLREHKEIYVYNNGIPGARMDMVQNCIDEELSTEKPDYVVLSFGGNDLGIWLYDALKPVTKEVLAERKKRNDSYRNALENIIVYLRSKNIEPIITTPLCYDQNLEERTGIETEKDNKEKAVITDFFFTRATFKSINKDGMQALAQIGFELAEKYDVTVWDFYSATINSVNHSHFNPDGVHYTPEGHKIIAKAIYENMFGAEPTFYPVSEKVKALSVLEADKRAYYFVKYNLVFLSVGRKDGQALIDEIKSFIDKKGYVEGLTHGRAEGFFRFVENPEQNQKNIDKAIKELYK